MLIIVKCSLAIHCFIGKSASSVRDFQSCHRGIFSHEDSAEGLCKKKDLYKKTLITALMAGRRSTVGRLMHRAIVLLIVDVCKPRESFALLRRQRLEEINVHRINARLLLLLLCPPKVPTMVLIVVEGRFHRTRWLWNECWYVARKASLLLLISKGRRHWLVLSHGERHRDPDSWRQEIIRIRIIGHSELHSKRVKHAWVLFCDAKFRISDGQTIFALKS